jgi:hypothetical protein
MDRACSAHGGDEKYIQNVGLESVKGRRHWEDLGIDGRLILKWILEKARLGLDLSSMR